MSRNIVAAVMALAVVVVQPGVLSAAEIKVWTARAIATVLAEIGSEFERETGHTLIVSSDLPPAFVRRVNAGEPFDLLISGSAPVDEWIRDGRIMAATRTDIARSGIGVEVRAGARQPDISSVDAFKRALLNARSIAYLRVGSGIYLAGLLERLGLAEAIRSKVTRPESDVVSELVAKGEVELGMTVITQILTTPGVDLVGPLPPEVQSYVTFAAGVSSHSKLPDAARQLIKFLTAPRAMSVIKAQGMEPAMTPDRQADEQHVRALDDQERIAALARDVPSLERLWSEHLTVNAPNNQVVAGGRAVLDTFIRAGVINFATFEREIEFIRADGAFVIIMGLETVKPLSDAPGAGLVAGRTIKRRFTNIWKKKRGRGGCSRGTRM